MKLTPFAATTAFAALVALAALVPAQIVRLDLPKMMASADDVVYGTIVDKHVIRIDHPIDGPELYYTTLTIQGRSLKSDLPLTVDVSHGGGFIDATRGAFNSEAPSADDERVGTQVVCFYKHAVNMGGDFEGNSIVAWHGGIFRTFERRGNVIVQGRGDGYAVSTNVALTDLGNQIKAIK
jgi:hypothetical protein